MAPRRFEVYNPDFALHSKFSWGEHKPCGKKYHEKLLFATDDIVYAIIDNDFLIPCTIITPTTRNYLKRYTKKTVVQMKSLKIPLLTYWIGIL